MEKKQFFIKTLCILAIVAAIVGATWDFSVQLQGVLYEEAYRTLSEVSEDYNKAFLDRINTHIKLLNVIAGSLEGAEDPTQDSTRHILQSAVDNSGFKRLVFSDINGMSYSNDGESTNVAHRDYFKQAKQGKTVISEPLKSALDGTGVIIISVPVRQKGQIMGVLFGSYSLSAAGSELLDSTYYSNGYGFVLSKNGDIVLSGDRADKLCKEKNLLRFLEKTTFIDFSMTDLSAAMEKGESGTFAFTYNGDRRFVCFTPSQVNDWYTFSFASDALMTKQEKHTSQIVLWLVLKLLAAGLLILILIIWDRCRHNKEILSANQRFQSLLANINGGVIVTTQSELAQEIKPTYVSEGFVQMTGYTVEDIQTLYDGQYIKMVHPDDRKSIFANYLEQIATAATYRLSYRIITKGGAILWVMDTGYVVKDKGNEILNHSVLTDITVIKRQEAELRLVDERFRIAIRASYAAVFEMDLQTKAYLYFENTEPLVGLSPEQLLDATQSFSGMESEEYQAAVKNFFFHPDDEEVLSQTFSMVVRGQPTNFEARIKKADGSYIWCKLDLGVITGEQGEPIRVVGYVTDISSIKYNTEFLESQMQIDTMTGIYNKVATATLINEILETDIDMMQALIILDIDNFKGVNDTLGHAFGDAVLIDVCGKLKTLFRSDDIVGRIGGDEFAVLMKNVPDTNHVLKKAAEIAGVFHQTYAGEKGDYKISCSMGIIIIRDKNDRYETLFPKADAALYQAKRNGKDMFVLYRQEDASQYPTERNRVNDTESQNMNRQWNIEERIFELLYASKDFPSSIKMALAMIGQHYHVSRAYIFENDEDNVYTSNTYEWCSSQVTSKIDKLQHLKISLGEESLLNCFDEKGLFYCNDIRTLAPYSKQILEFGGVLSTLQMTIVNDEKIKGFIGFDECTEYRAWTADEIDTLSFLAKILSIFLLKSRFDI